MSKFSPVLALSIGLLSSACGTAYVLPEVDDASANRAAAMFDSAQQISQPQMSSTNVAMARFKRVAPRIEQVGETLCQRETAELEGFDCDVEIGIDNEMPQRNAYFTYKDTVRKRDPIIMVTAPMLRDVRNDDELAFVLGHEYGHLIGRHIEKRQQQALAGALIMGVIAAAATAGDPYADPNIVSDSMELGYVTGQFAFSQEYELESDTLGTLITMAAGYDAEKGALFFARGEEQQISADQLSFWGTHPPDEKRLATVFATVQQIKAQGGIARKGEQ